MLECKVCVAKNSAESLMNIAHEVSVILISILFTHSEYRIVSAQAIAIASSSQLSEIVHESCLTGVQSSFTII